MAMNYHLIDWSLIDIERKKPEVQVCIIPIERSEIVIILQTCDFPYNALLKDNVEEFF